MNKPDQHLVKMDAVRLFSLFSMQVNSDIKVTLRSYHICCAGTSSFGNFEIKKFTFLTATLLPFKIVKHKYTVEFTIYLHNHDILFVICVLSLHALIVLMSMGHFP